MRKSNEIALVGVLSALQIIVLSIGYFVDVVSLSANMIASFILMITLTRKMYRHTLLGAVAVAIIAFFVMNVHALPYVLFTAPMTVFTCFAYEKKLNKVLAWVIKLVWTNVVFFLCYEVFSLVFIDFDELGFVVPYYGLAIIVTLAEVGVNYVMLYFYRYVDRLSERLFQRFNR